MPDSNDRPVPENFHALYDQGSRASRGTLVDAAAADTAGHQRLAQEVPRLAVEYDEATRLPNLVCSHEPAARLSAAAASPEEAARTFVKERCDLWNMSDADAETVEVVSVSGRGLRTVRLQQRLEGKEVFNAEVNAAVSADNEVISVSGQLFPGASATRAAARAAPATPAAAAISHAAFDLTGLVYDADEITEAEARDDSGPYRDFVHQLPDNDDRPPFERPVRLKDVMFPIGEGQFVAGYYMELWIKGLPAFSYVIDAVGDPDVLFRKNLTSGIAFRYNVHNTGDAVLRPEDGPAPGTPHPTGLPDGFQAPTIAESLIEVESLLPGDPWLPDGATTTDGNNCIAYADISSPQGLDSGDVLGQISASGTFDHTYDHSRNSSTSGNLQASLVGMFFHVNWLHDRWYEAGFDEAAGNAQKNNFGRGGLGGDPILAEGNDSSGTDNANMSTPADGSSPRMQMFEFTGPPGPTRTSNHEALITFHEMGHYITNRLVANASGLFNQQGRAMGEGWGDFFAICMTSQDGDDFDNGAFAVGGWTDLTPSFNDNYYFSIRRYPYSADMTKNPLTFRHISAGVVLPMGPPRRPGSLGGNNSFHKAGEIWCSALWEVFVNLVGLHGHAEGESRVLRYVVGGLKLTPAGPTFLQARDAILSAVSALDPSDLGAVWEGFAKRGMGTGALGPSSSSTSLTGVTESFQVP